MRYSKWTNEQLADAVRNSEGIAGVIRYLGLRQAGGTNSHLKLKIKQAGLDTSHFTGSGHRRGIHPPTRKTAAEILVNRPDGERRESARRLRRSLLEIGIPHACKLCGISEWNEQPIVLEIDHIDGNWLDDRAENLRFICPNCHSQQKKTNSPHKHTRMAERQTHSP